MTLLHTETVRPDWVDYNGHMNVAYYVLVFDHATDGFMDAVGLGAAYRESTGGTLFVVDSHVTYQAETAAGDELAVETRVLDVADKKIHLFHRMTRRDEEATVATNEIMLLHVDLNTRRTAPMPDGILDEIRALEDRDGAMPLPAEVGRRVAMTR
jgi:acyl-CoA thioester hydrolase